MVETCGSYVALQKLRGLIPLSCLSKRELDRQMERSVKMAGLGGGQGHERHWGVVHQETGISPPKKPQGETLRYHLCPGKASPV